MPVILARKGYVTVRNPTPQAVAAARARTGDSGDPETNPDYLIEGRVFDCYAPSTVRARNAWSIVRGKVLSKQTQRVLVDLRSCAGNAETFRHQFEQYPIPGLKEVKLLTKSEDIINVSVRRE